MTTTPAINATDEKRLLSILRKFVEEGIESRIRLENAHAGKPCEQTPFDQATQTGGYPAACKAAHQNDHDFDWLMFGSGFDAFTDMLIEEGVERLKAELDRDVTNIRERASKAK